MLGLGLGIGQMLKYSKEWAVGYGSPAGDPYMGGIMTLRKKNIYLVERRTQKKVLKAPKCAEP